jgi:hypothetical protein
MMPLDLAIACTTGAVVLLLIASRIARRDFDPFAPIWLFLVGYAQVYVVQAISYRDYAIRVRGEALVTEANLRALWALVWFLLVYHCGLAKRIARRLPSAPTTWSTGLVVGVTPLMVVWGLICAGVALREIEVAQEENILRQFPIMLLAAGVMLLVTGRQPARPRAVFTIAGLALVCFYIFIWMFNGRRSHAVIGVLAGVCAWYLPRWRRPSVAGMLLTGAGCALAVSLALGWRGNTRHDPSPAGFIRYLCDFDPESILVNMNIKENIDPARNSAEMASKETEEYGGFLLMMHAVPELSDFDFGASYLRILSTYIPRIVWPDKPIFGRDAWVNAWITGSEFPRDRNFTGPAIGILGATQLNGGAVATFLVMAFLALMLRTAYDYFRFHSDTAWAQVWWPLTYYNAWLMTVNDDPMVWFYYIYGHTTLPPLAALWVYHKLQGDTRSVAAPAALIAPASFA